MKPLKNCQKSLAAAAMFSLITAFPAASTTVNTLTSQDIQLSIIKLASSPASDEYQLAQTPDNCRRVATQQSDNLNVRYSPDGAIIGTLRNQTLVIIENYAGDWVKISSPQSGYVSAKHLESCQQPVPPSETATSSDNCRKIFVGGVLRVRQQPSINSPILGVLESGQRVIIKNRGKDGWVPISSPVNGYIPSIVLRDCSGN